MSTGSWFSLLAGHSDVDKTPAINGDVLVYDDSVYLWKPTQLTTSFDLRYLKLSGSNANVAINIGSQNFLTTGTLEAGATTLTGALNVTIGSAVPAVNAKITGDIVSRIQMTTDGGINFGTGSAIHDVNLYRSAANTLKTDDAFAADSIITSVIDPSDAILTLDGEIRFKYAGYSIGTPTIPCDLLWAEGIYFSNYTNKTGLIPATITIDKVIIVPNANGTMAVSASSPISLSAAGDIGFLFNTANTWTNTQYINKSDVAALKVGSTPAFQVDTVNNVVAIGRAPLSFNWYILDVYKLAVPLSTAAVYGIGLTISSADGQYTTLSSSRNFYGLNLQPSNYTGYRGNAIMSMYGADFSVYDYAGQASTYSHGGTGDCYIDLYGINGTAFGQHKIEDTGNNIVRVWGAQVLGLWNPVVKKPSSGVVTPQIYGGKFTAWVTFGSQDSTDYRAGSVTGGLICGGYFKALYYPDTSDLSNVDWKPPIYGGYFVVEAPVAAYFTDLVQYAGYFDLLYETDDSWNIYVNTAFGKNLLGKDNVKSYFGTGLDLALYHDGTNSFIYNDTGILKIQDAGSGIWIGTASTELLSFYGGTAVNRPDALTAQLTTITHTAPVTPDYAIQNFTQVTPFGFVTADEANTVLSVVANLQTRLAQVEARLEELNLITPN